MTDAIVVCRLCLNDSDSYVDIHSDNSHQHELDKKILRYLGLQIKEDDPHSKFVCSKCIDRLEDFHTFSSKVSANQLQLSNSNSIIISNEKKRIAQLDEYVVTMQTSGQNHTARIEPHTVIDGHQSSTSIRDLGMSEVNDVRQVNNKSNKIMENNEIVELNNRIEQPLQIKEEIVDIDVVRKSKRTSLPRVAKKIKYEVEDYVEDYVEDDAEDDVEDDIADDSNDVYDLDKTANLNENDDEKSSDPSECDLFADHEKYAGFPKVVIKNSKLIFEGNQLLDLMSRFYRLECEICIESQHTNKTIYSRISTLCQHYNEVHSIKGYVTCCGLRLIKPNAMAMHMAKHLQPDAFQCPSCDKQMTCPKALQYHIQNHHQRLLACPECPRKFSYSAALEAHSISHQPESEIERAAHTCDECGKSFSSLDSLSRHINATHTSRVKEYICHICAKKLAGSKSLEYHLSTHQPKIKQAQCELCGKFFKNQLCLGKHMIQHSTVRFTCELCDYSAVNKQCLRHHVNVHHSDLKPFTCQVCDKTFKLRSTLENHLVVHTGICKFACDFCNRTFGTSGNYYAHGKRMHPEELAAANEKKKEEEQKLREKLFETR